MSRRLRLLPLIATAGLVACAPPRGGGPPMPPPAAPETILVPGVPQLIGPSAGVKVGLTVYIAGQVGVDSAGRAAAEFGAQAAQAFRNLLRVVQAARGVPGDVVQLTVYYVPQSAEDGRRLTQLVDELFSSQHPPALTLVAVPFLPLPELRVSVAGVAVLRGEFPDRRRGRD